MMRKEELWRHQRTRKSKRSSELQVAQVRYEMLSLKYKILWFFKRLLLTTGDKRPNLESFVVWVFCRHPITEAAFRGEADQAAEAAVAAGSWELCCVPACFRRRGAAPGWETGPWASAAAPALLGPAGWARWSWPDFVQLNLQKTLNKSVLEENCSILTDLELSSWRAGPFPLAPLHSRCVCSSPRRPCTRRGRRGVAGVAGEGRWCQALVWVRACDGCALQRPKRAPGTRGTAGLCQVSEGSAAMPAGSHKLW